MVKFAGKRKTKRKTDYNLQHFKNSTVLVHDKYRESFAFGCLKLKAGCKYVIYLSSMNA